MKGHVLPDRWQTFQAETSCVLVCTEIRTFTYGETSCMHEVVLLMGESSSSPSHGHPPVSSGATIQIIHGKDGCSTSGLRMHGLWWIPTDLVAVVVALGASSCSSCPQPDVFEGAVRKQTCILLLIEQSIQLTGPKGTFMQQKNNSSLLLVSKEFSALIIWKSLPKLAVTLKRIFINAHHAYTSIQIWDLSFMQYISIEIYFYLAKKKKPN